MYTLFVTLDVHPDKVDEFVDAISVNAAASLRDESGCLVFDVHRDVENPTRFYLYEVYTDEDAFRIAHRSIRITRAGKKPRQGASSTVVTATPSLDQYGWAQSAKAERLGRCSSHRVHDGQFDHDRARRASFSAASVPAEAL